MAKHKVTSLIPNRSLSIVMSEDMPEYFQPEELASLLSPEMREKRYKAYVLCLFLLHTGARVSEALNVRVKDIDMSARTVRVITLKRRVPVVRVIPVQPSLIGELAVYISTFSLKREDRLFNFNRHTAFYHVRQLCAMAGIKDSRSHPHTFRHTFAVTLIRQGVPVTVLKELLGHRDIMKTLIYTKINAVDSRVFIDSVKF